MVVTVGMSVVTIVLLVSMMVVVAGR